MSASTHAVDTASAQSPKVHRSGTHRVRDPEETLEWVAPFLPQLGITRVADVTGLDHIGIPVWTAIRPNSRSLAVSQGKGLSHAAAQASAVMESIELHHAERPLVPLLLASTVELQHSEHEPVDVTCLAGTSTSRYRPTTPLLWAETMALRDGRAVWVPFETVHTNALRPAPLGSGCFSSTSNGLASGNVWHEAVVHAVSEVIERDAAAVWQAQRADRRAATAVDLTTIDDPDCNSVIDRFVAAQVSVRVHEITSDVGVPAFLCEIASTEDGASEMRYSGMGCHLWPEIALLRAMTEAAQSRLTYITGSRDDLSRSDYRAVRHAVRPDDGPSPTRPFRAAPPAPDDCETLADDLDELVRRLETAGLDTVLVVDLTSPELGIPVVRVVVPGLEGPDDEPTYVPGRRAQAAARSPQ